MKTRRIKGNDIENTGVLPVFVTVDAVTYILCNQCGLPMTTSNVCWWQEDKHGKSYNINLLHYNCRERFKRTHTGIWFERGMLSVKVKLNLKKAKPLLRKRKQKGVDDS